MTFDGQSYYEILEITEDASLQEIERAYLTAKETYSSNSSALYSMFSQEETLELHRLIEEAYNTLSNHSLRKEYDSKNVELSFEEQPEEETPFDSHSPASSVSKTNSQPDSAVTMENGLIISQFKKDPSIEDKIKNVSDCSGSFLQKIRTYKNISLDDVSKFSKISKTNILAVENEDFTNLPAKVFVRGFVSQISKLLGLDHDRFTKEYMINFNEQRK